MSGYFGIGIYGSKNSINVGGLWRSANTYDASFIFTIGKRYKHQPSDVHNTPNSIPLYDYENFDDLKIPYDCQLVGIELIEGAIDLPKFKHPKRCIYLLGAEDYGLPQSILKKCQHIVQIPSTKPHSLNVASSGSIVMYDRMVQNESR